MSSEMGSSSGSVGGCKLVPFSGGLPEAAAPVGHPQVSRTFPSRFPLHGHHRQPSGAPQCLRGQPHPPGGGLEEGHPRGALVRHTGQSHLGHKDVDLTTL